MSDYQDYLQLMHRIADLSHASAVLQWDQEINLPEKGAALRGQQIGTLSEMAHELFVREKNRDLFQRLADNPALNERERRNAVLSLQDYEDRVKFTPAFVREMSMAAQKSYHSWIKARKENNFGFFEEDLGALITLKKQAAELAGYQGHPYDALLDEFDKGATAALLDPIFASLQAPLVDLLGKIKDKPQVRDDFLRRHFPKDRQWEIGLRVIRDMGFDLTAGRQDISVHPFTITFNNKDVRVTTRVDENDFPVMLWSCIHEAGHGLYEQGLPDDGYGLPLGQAVSLSIHESQSRLWENEVGRSRPFTDHYFPIIQARFPGVVDEVSALDFYQAVNRVSPSLIRVQADELSYHFHILIRYQIEKKLIGGEMTVKEIPELWDALYQEYLGVRPPDHLKGCLQDIHWSQGMFGYFPTYSLGSFYAAQFFAQAKKEIDDLPAKISRGEFQPLREWLRTRIHQQGRFYNSEELCRKITGEGLSTAPFLARMREKYSEIYGITTN